MLWTWPLYDQQQVLLLASKLIGAHIKDTVSVIPTQAAHFLSRFLQITYHFTPNKPLLNAWQDNQRRTNPTQHEYLENNS